VLEGAARSLRQHGFAHIFFLGDHGGYRQSLERVAERLNKAWAREPGPPPTRTPCPTTTA
jgi:creatinine amidohydrolase/Fe(II)-dependent formamide hydrolase-like protein